jgi:hypothetical protein
MDVRLVHFIMCSNLATRRLRKPLSRDHRIWLAPAMSTQALGRRAIWVDFSPSSYDTVSKNVRHREVRCILATAV